MKGIILAGGTGSRLWPMTRAASKQLLPVWDKPMIYYPLSVLMLARIRDILVITTPEDAQAFENLLGDGTDWGLQLSYKTQDRPDGIARALQIGADFSAGAPTALILGDNLFFGQGLSDRLANARAEVEQEGGAAIFTYRVADPRRYGVVGFDGQGRPNALVEKPADPPSPHAVTGLYFYDGTAAARAASLTPSARGELEITDLNRAYLEEGALHAEMLGRGFAWLDTGTPESLLDAANFVGTLEKRQGVKIACPEEIAFAQGWIDRARLAASADALGQSAYGAYLRRLADGG